MNEKFDYKDSLTDIKASLFDIYEDQERVIGSIAPSLRDKHVSEFIEVKDLALSLLEKIQKLYDNSLVFEDNNIETNDEKLSDLEENDSTEDVDSDNSDINFGDEAGEETTTDDQESGEEEISDLENNDSTEDVDSDNRDINFGNEAEEETTTDDQESGEEEISDLENNDSTEDVDSDNSDINFGNETEEETTTDDQESGEEETSDLENNDSTEDVDSDNSDINFGDEAVEKTTTDDQESDEADTSDLEEANSNKYYLLCDEGKLHFAYVSEKLFNKIKNYRDPGDNLLEADTDLDSSTFDGKIYKKDDLPVKGIIVRNDQYMKLALSKHRQEGVLKEAKNYRVETVRRKRQEQQKIELEKAKVHLDI